MKKVILLVILTIFLLPMALLADSAELRSVVAQNPQTPGGELRIDIEARITSGVSPQTLNSFTCDFYYSGDITYAGVTGWVISSTSGYARVNSSLVYNGLTYIRLGATGNGVNENGGGDPPGYDVSTEWQRIVTLRFTINSPTATSASFNIRDVTNAFACFNNYQNNPYSMVHDFVTTNYDLGEVILTSNPLFSPVTFTVNAAQNPAYTGFYLNGNWDATGHHTTALSERGIFHDDGINGDATAGDHIFTSVQNLYYGTGQLAWQWQLFDQEHHPLNQVTTFNVPNYNPVAISYALPAPLYPPNQLAAEIVSYNDVQLTWQAPQLPVGLRANVQDKQSRQVRRVINGYKIYKDNALLTQVDANTTQYLATDLTGGEHTFKVTALYDEGEGLPAEISVTINIAAPTNLTAVPQESPYGVVLTWQAPPSPIVRRAEATRQQRALTNYRIFRNDTQIGETAELTFTDLTGQGNVQYNYHVVAVYSNQYVSGASNSVSIMFPGIFIPPTQLHAALSNFNNVTLTWQAPQMPALRTILGKSGNLAQRTERRTLIGYKVYKNDEQVTQLESNILTYALNNLAGGQYTFGVTALYDDGESAPATATLGIALPAPSNLSGEIGTDHISLSWQAPVIDGRFSGLRDLTGYRVFRNDEQLIETTTLSYDDFSGTVDMQYNYHVVAVYSSQYISEASNTVSFTFPGPFNQPLNVEAAVVNDNDITLNWDAPAGGVQIIHDQLDPQGETYGKACQNFEADLNAYDCEAAGDFVVTSDVTLTAVQLLFFYNQESTEARTFNIAIYADNAGAPQETALFTTTTVSTTPDENGIFDAALTTPISLTAGTYWLGYAMNLDYGTLQIIAYTLEHTTLENGTGAFWRNPGNGFNTGYTTWSHGILNASGQMRDVCFALMGIYQSVPTAAINTPQVVAPGNNVKQRNLSINSYAVCPQLPDFGSRQTRRTHTGYKIYKNGQFLTTVASPTTYTYTDSDLNAGNYTYGVSAVYDAGESEQTTTAINLILAVPQNLTATVNPNRDRIILGWDLPVVPTRNERSLSGYRVYRNNALLATTTTNHYLDANFDLDVEYSYYVVALYSNQYESQPSNTATINVVEATENVAYANRVLGNYPNPFNPSTNIRYTLAETSQVKIVIYNQRGQLITTLFQGQQNRGPQTVTWNGKDHSGKTCGSGIYFFNLECKGAPGGGSKFTSTKKMVLLK